MPPDIACQTGLFEEKTYNRDRFYPLPVHQFREGLLPFAGIHGPRQRAAKYRDAHRREVRGGFAEPSLVERPRTQQCGPPFRRAPEAGFQQICGQVAPVLMCRRSARGEFGRGEEVSQGVRETGAGYGVEWGGESPVARLHRNAVMRRIGIIPATGGESKSEPNHPGLADMAIGNGRLRSRNDR